jgi:hypothetical protein
MAESEENTSKKMKKTAEHGQILMTVENLFQKCLKRKEMIISMKEFMEKDPPKNFDDMGLSGENAVAQLNIVKQCLENFIRLKRSLDDKTHIRDEKIRKRDNYESTTPQQPQPPTTKKPKQQ